MSLPALRLLPGADVSAPAPPRAPALRLVVAWPAAPMPVVARPALTPFMQRCLLLALLLHVWLVLMLGNAPGGTAAPGQGVAGTLNITLRGPETPGATAELLPPPVPVVPEGPTGTAAQPRWGGQVRKELPAEAPALGAAQLGRWAAEPAPAAPAALLPPPPPPPGRVVEERAAPAPEAVRPWSPTPTLAPAPVPETAPPPDPAPAPQPAAAERSLQAPALRAAAPSLPALAPLPATAPLPALVMDAPPAALPLQRLARPSATAEQPTAAAPLPAEPVAVAPAALPLPDLPALAVPVAPTAAEPAAPARAVVAPPLATPPAAPTPAPPGPQPTPPALRAEAVPASPAPAPAAAPAAAAPPRAGEPQPAAERAPLRAGVPDAGPQLGRDVATPPAPAAQVLPRLNLQLQRPRGGELSRGRSAGALPVLPRLPEVDEKLGRDISKSARADCREAYRGGGLAAAVPLVADALKKDSGCKW